MKSSWKMACIILTTFLLPAMLWAQSSVTGTVLDEKGNPVVGANIVIEGTTLGAATDMSGFYRVLNVPPGSVTVKVFYIGYKSQEKSVTVPRSGEVQANFTLRKDILDMSSVVVTGMANPKEKLESSVAVTTVSAPEIRELNPPSSAELLKIVPGFYVEASGGDVGNNLFARGIPAAGAYEDVQVQEDGLPVFEDGALQFSNVDNYYRLDETIERVESVRGGSGAIFASNAPGGIVNYISKTGGAEFSGVAKITAGDYGLVRTDLDFGGPILEDLRYNIGGFYRVDQGVRPLGDKVPANRGGQIKANLTKLMDGGYLRVNFKYLNDRNIFYLPIPLQNQTNPEGIPGFDPNYGTMTSINASKLRVPIPGGGKWQRDLSNGIHPEVTAFGGELNKQLGSGWTIKDKFRNTGIILNYDAMFSMGAPMSATDYAESEVGGQNYKYYYADTQTPINNPAGLNGNGLVVKPGFWTILRNLDNFVNNLSFTKSTGNHNVTAGYYFSTYSADQKWYWSQMLMEVADQARLLDLVATDSTGAYKYTYHGVSDIGFYGRNSKLNGTINALFLDDEFTVGDHWNIEAGIRYEMATYSGYKEVDGTGDLPGMDSTYAAPLRTGWSGSGQMQYFTYDADEFAWSVGANYTLSENLGVFARASDGFRTPIEEAYMGNMMSLGNIKPTDVKQYELGVKFSSPVVAVFASGFYMQMKNIPFQDVLASGQTENKFAGANNIGLEVETTADLANLRLNLKGTVQNPTFTDFKYRTAAGTTVNNNGNQVRRIPKIFLTFRPSYEIIPDLNVFVSVNYNGEKYQDNENKATLPAYTVFGAGAGYTVERLRFAINVTNLTNTIGLTEGDPRVQNVPTGQYYMARPILGRSIRVSVGYNF